MKTGLSAIALGLLAAAMNVHADAPPGNQVRIRPTHDRYTVTLTLSPSGATPCGSHYAAMALLGEGGGVLQDPFIVPSSSVFVATDFDWSAEPMYSDAVAAEWFTADDDVVLVPFLYRSQLNSQIVSPRFAVGHRSLETGMGWIEKQPVCISAQRRNGSGYATLENVSIQGYVDDLLK